MNTVTLNLPNNAVITVNEDGDILIKMGKPTLRGPIPNNPPQFDPMHPANMWGGPYGTPYNPMQMPQFQHPMSQPFPTYQPNALGQFTVNGLSTMFTNLAAGFNATLNDLVDWEPDTIKQSVLTQLDQLIKVFYLKSEYIDESVNTLVCAPLVKFTVGVKYTTDTTGSRSGRLVQVILGRSSFAVGTQDTILYYDIGIKHDCVYISVNTVTKSAE